MSVRPLAGLKVADFSWVVAGPVIGRVLADFGASVVRLETSRRVDTARLMGPFPGGKPDRNRSGLYENCNAGKHGLTIDLSTPPAQAVARDLVTWAEVVIESFTPGQMQRWGLHYEAVRQINPGVIMLSTTLMGQQGPYAQLAGYGNLGAAMSGFQGLVGHSGQMPIGPYGPYTDYVGPRFSLAAVLAALDRKRRTGEGAWLDVSQVDAGIQFLAPQFADYFATGRLPQPLGNRDSEMAPHGVYPGSEPDTWVAIAVRDDHDWEQFSALLGPEASHARFRTLAGRKADEAALESMVATWTAAHPVQRIETLLQAAGIPAHVVASSEDMNADPQLAARGHFVRFPHPLGGDGVVEGPRFALSETPGHVDRPAPVYGLDNRRVLQDFLRYDEARIAALEAAGVLV